MGIEFFELVIHLCYNRTVILELQEQGLGSILPIGIESPSFFV